MPCPCADSNDAAWARILAPASACFPGTRGSGAGLNWPGLGRAGRKVAAPAGGESGGRQTVRIRGGRSGPVTQQSLRVMRPSYQSVRQDGCSFAIGCGAVASSIPGAGGRVAAFSDLDKTIISKSSTLAYGPSFYRNGLISRSDAVRGAVAQLVFTRRGAGPRRRLSDRRADAGSSGPSARGQPRPGAAPAGRRAGLACPRLHRAAPAPAPGPGGPGRLVPLATALHAEAGPAGMGTRQLIQITNPSRLGGFLHG